MFILKDLIASILLVVTFGLINYTYDNPNVFNLIVTIIYLLLWLGYGFIMGMKKKPRFIYFTMLFWIGLFIIAAIPYIIIDFGVTWNKDMLNIFNIISYPSNIIHAPLYGFWYTSAYQWLEQLDLKYSIQVFVTILPLGITILGYYLGKTTNRKLNTKTLN